MNQLIKIISLLSGIVLFAGCATEGVVSTSVTYYDPYPQSAMKDETLPQSDELIEAIKWYQYPINA